MSKMTNSESVNKLYNMNAELGNIIEKLPETKDYFGLKRKLVEMENELQKLIYDLQN